MREDVYDQNGNLLMDFDPMLGRVVEGTRTVHVAEQQAIEEQSRLEVLKTYPNGGKDVRRVVDVEGQPYIPAHDEQVECLVYIPYTEEELEEMRRPTQEMRIAALEKENADLKEAMELLLSGEVSEDG